MGTLETCSSGDLQLADDQLDNLASLLNPYETPAGLDELLRAPTNLPALDFDHLLHSDNSPSGLSRGLRHSLRGQPEPSDDAMVQQQEEDEQGDGKRRRRIRNAKQQELNRLAQQRYRQRKKQKVVDLQDTVAELSSKMATIARLEDEAVELKRREVSAQELAATRQATLLQAQVAIQHQAIVIEQQRKQLEFMKQQEAAGASSRPTSPTPNHQQQAALCDRLVEALRAALADVCAEQGLHASSAAQEQVLLRFQRSVHSCYKEVITVAATPAPTDAQQAPAGAAPVPTSAGSQKPAKAAHLVSIPCY